MRDDKSLVNDPGAEWPIASMLLIGTFGGSHSASGRRYHRQVWSTAAFLIVGSLVGTILIRRFGFSQQWTAALLMGGGFAYIARAMWQYVSTLDELARRLQMEAMAVTYLLGLVLFMILSGASMGASWQMNPGMFLLLEPLRGVVLVVMSRKYR